MSNNADLSAVLRAFQKVLPTYQFDAPKSEAETFAQTRFHKKMEVPNHTSSAARKLNCWDSWIEHDNRLPTVIRLPSKEWYQVREFLHKNLNHVRLSAQVRFPKGSEFIPTRGLDSLESRLSRSKWTCTSDAFLAFARICYNSAGLKRAVRRRYRSWFFRTGLTDLRSADRFLYQKFLNRGVQDIGFDIFAWKLSQVTKIERGSRFSNVPKNNLVDRPINIEPFGNMIVQLGIGSFIRKEIHRLFKHDLDHLADEHRFKIQNVNAIATIDLKNASDSVSMALCKFLLPQHLYKQIAISRSEMVYGFDDNYHLINKVSSMGNGFTFELMTLILTSLCKVLDSESSVFGDDIIIAKDQAPRLIKLLEEVGFIVNKDKTFIDGDFRESCGANYLLGYGYIESYDFKYPNNIGDCVMLFNKALRLSVRYPSFMGLYKSLYRIIPPVLRGGPNDRFIQADLVDLIGNSWNDDTDDRSVDFPLYFVTNGKDLERAKRVNNKDVDRYIEGLKYDPNRFRLVAGFEFKSKLASPTVRVINPNRHWAKYLMYLYTGRVSKDVNTSDGIWCTVWFYTDGFTQIRASQMKRLTSVVGP